MRIVVQWRVAAEDAVEDLRLATNVELRGWLVQQDDAGSELDGAQRARQRDALPLAARQVGAALVASGEHRVEGGQVRRASRRRARRGSPCLGAPAGATLSRSGQLESGEILEYRGQTRRARIRATNSRRSTPSISMAPDCGSYSRHSSLASVVLPAPFCPTMASDEPAGNREIEAL